MVVYLKQVGAYICRTTAQLLQLLTDYQDHTYGQVSTDDIKNVYIVPSKFITASQTSSEYDGDITPISYNFDIIKNATLDGYTPRNKKLLTYPYCYMMLSNNTGISNILHYEKFKGTDCTFTIKGIPTPRLFY